VAETTVKDFYSVGFDAVIKRCDKCINVGGEYVEKLMFSQVRMSYILRFMPIFDLFIVSVVSLEYSTFNLIELSSLYLPPSFLPHSFPIPFIYSSCRHSSIDFVVHVFLLKQFEYISFKICRYMRTTRKNVCNAAYYVISFSARSASPVNANKHCTQTYILAVT
jgi:hypothetical protein